MHCSKSINFKSTCKGAFYKSLVNLCCIVLSNSLRKLLVCGQGNLKWKCQNTQTDTNKNIEHSEDILSMER